MINFKKTKLSNGLKIITVPMHETKAVTVMLLVGVGSRYEEKSVNGISHFLEHMFFKGTGKRPSTLDISQELDSVGATYNAFTSEEETGFYIKVPYDHFDKALDIIIDMIFNSKFDPDEIQREKGVIFEEINMYQDVPQQYIFDLTKKLFYGQTSLGRSTLGIKNTVEKINRNKFISYKNKYYHPGNMILVISGNPGKYRWIESVKNYLEDYPNKKNYPLEKIFPKQNNPNLLMHYKKTDQAHLTIGFRTFSRTDKRRPILKIINNILGETMSSRLFTQVRERRGLAYYIGTDLWDFEENGALVSFAGVDIKRIELAIKVILEEIYKIKNYLLSDEEINKAKENLKGRMYINLEDSMSVASFLAEQELFWKEIEKPEKIIHDIMKVAPLEVKKISEKIFTKNNLNVTIISPLKNKNSIYKLLKI